MRKAVWAIVVAVAAALAGCGGGEEPAAPERPKTAEQTAERPAATPGARRPAPDPASGRPAVPSAKTDATPAAVPPGTVKVPADFPKDVFVQAGANVQATIKTDETNLLRYLSNDAPGKVAEAYRAEMAKSGWTEAPGTPPSADVTILNYTKGQETVSVQIVGGGTLGTEVLLSVSKDPSLPE